MFDENDLSLGFEDDLLPPGQAPIITKNIEKFNLAVRLLIEAKQKTGYNMMGVATGRPGVGKTIAILNYLNSQAARPHTGLPACLGIRVAPQSSPKVLMEDLYARLGQRAPRLNRQQVANEAAKVIIEHDIRLIFVDESDLLDEDGFEFLRYVFGKTACPVFIVGSPSILDIVERQEKFASRINQHFRFLPPTEEEVLDTILPQLVIPRWTYDPQREADRKVGKELWRKARSSFRELRALIALGSQLAEIAQQDTVTPDVLKQAYAMRFTRKLPSPPRKGEGQPASPTTKYEDESHQRQDAKQRRKRGQGESDGQ
jgi:DNA transposition AAA+ family ATPase